MTSYGGAVGLLDLTYTIDNPSVGQFVCVVQGANDGSCATPAGANAAGFLGITQGGQPYQGHSVAVRRKGISIAAANGPINRGDRLAIASAAGDVESVEAALAAGLANPAKVYNVIGTAENTVTDANQTLYVFLNPETVPLAVS